MSNSSVDILELLSSLDPHEFETYVANYLLPILGLKVVNVIGGAYDRGCDIIAEDERFGSRICVQVKRYSRDRKVTERDVRSVRIGMENYNCNRGLIVTTSDLNGPALESATRYGIDYINGSRLVELIKSYGIPVPLTYPRKISAHKLESDAKEKEKDKSEHEMVSHVIKDDGVYIPLGISDAISKAKEHLMSLGALQPSLKDVEANLKRLYIFKAKASFKLKGRRSLSTLLGVDGDGNIYEEIPVLNKTIDCNVKYETDRELYYTSREKAIEYVTNRLIPFGATDIQIKLDNYKLAWTVSYYVLRFKIGLTEAIVRVDRFGKAEVLSVAVLTPDDIRKVYPGAVTRQGDNWVVTKESEKFIEIIKLNRFGEVISKSKTIKPDYAKKLVASVDKGNVVYVENNYAYSDHGDFLHRCAIDENENVTCIRIGIGSSSALSLAKNHFRSSMFAEPQYNNVVFSKEKVWTVKLAGVTGEVEYNVSLDGKLTVIRRAINEAYAKSYLARYPSYIVKSEGQSIVGLAKDGKFLYYYEWKIDGSIKTSIKRLDPDYAIALTRKMFGLNGGVARYKAESSGVKVDILYSGFHYLARIDNEGNVVDRLIVPDVSLYQGKEKGYNKNRRCLIVKKEEKGEDVILVVGERGLIEEKRIPKSPLKRLLASASALVTGNYSIDTVDPLDLI